MGQSNVLIRMPLMLPTAGGPNRHRRANARHTPVELSAWLAWETERSVYRVPARLVDISRGGAAVELDADVPPVQCLEFGLSESPADHVSLAATVVRIAAIPRGGHRIHLAFTAECPDALLKRAMFGARGTMRRSVLSALASATRSFLRWACRAGR
jgi:PilZ domain